MELPQLAREYEICLKKKEIMNKTNIGKTKFAYLSNIAPKKQLDEGLQLENFKR